MYVIFIGAVYRYYESRRRIYNGSKPSRLAAKKTNEKKNRIRNRQRQVQLLMSVMYDFGQNYQKNLCLKKKRI